MLSVNGVTLDPSDLEACYAQAWQGLYMALLEGQEVASPTGWLALVTFRRAIEEQRARIRSHCGSVAGDSGVDAPGPKCAGQDDLAAELDDRVKLRQLFEGLRARLSKRELRAATLCYLQGLSRAEAAVQMGLSEKGMSKLMEGRGPGHPGVAGKVGTLVQAIGRGDWCEEQGSLMRGFAYGILDPAGERYQLAVSHHSQCPACRAYVVSLRGLAAVLPLPPLPLSLIAAVSAGARAGGTGARAAGTGATGVGARAAGAGAEAAGPGLAGAGGAGGGWLFAGGAGAKLALGCAVAVSIGAGCVALSAGPVIPRRAHHIRALSKRVAARATGRQPAVPALAAARSPTTSGPRKSAQPMPPAGGTGQAPGSTATRQASTSPPKASREFGIEQPAGSVSSAPERESAEPRPTEPRPGESHQASAAAAGSRPRSSTPGEEAASTAAPRSTEAAQPSSGAAAAAREFGPG
jgi:DNA-directed RNA polymerase specialized sigma24 family protein